MSGETAGTDQGGLVEVVLYVKHHAAPWVGGHMLGIALAMLAGAVAWRVVLARFRSVLRRRTAPQQTMAEHIAPLIGYRGPDAEALLAGRKRERVIIRQWPDDPDQTGAVIACAYMKGRWDASDAALRQVERVAGQCQGGRWVATPDVGRRWVVLTRKAPEFVLPDRLDYTDTTGRVDLVPVGVRGDGRPVIYDLGSESPHVLIGAKTRSGKTSLETLIAAHVAGHGGIVTIADPKRVGFRHFRDLPNVKVVTGPLDLAGAAAEMHAALTEFRAEMEHRYALIEAGTDEATFTPWVFITDEFGSLSQMLAGAWKGRGQHPMQADYQWCLWRGAQARMHLVTASQQPNVAVLGSSDAREQYDLKIALGNPERATATMLFGDGAQLPNVPDGRGRAVVKFDGGLETVQIAYLPEAKAREIASTGTGRFPVTEPQATPDPTPTATTAPPLPPTGTRQQTPEHTETDGLRAPARWGTTDTRTHAVEQAPPPTGQSVTCHRCGHGWTTTAKPGSSVRCPKPDCRHSRRVPAAVAARR